jgi:hypothetical protein
MTTHALPPVVDAATWERRLQALRAREKAAARELDAIAAERRRLPMVEMPDYTLASSWHCHTPSLLPVESHKTRHRLRGPPPPRFQIPESRFRRDAGASPVQHSPRVQKGPTDHDA